MVLDTIKNIVFSVILSNLLIMFRKEHLHTQEQELNYIIKAVFNLKNTKQ